MRIRKQGTRRVDTATLSANHVANIGPSCTSAAVLTALGGLGATGLPSLATASAHLSGTGVAYMPPAWHDYIGIPFLRRAPLDVRIEALAADAGLRVRSRTRPSLVPLHLVTTRAREVVIGNMAFGREAPGTWGAWGVKPLDRRTWGEGGHSVVIARRRGFGWDVVDSNHDGVQHWRLPGIAPTVTRIRSLS